MSKTPHPIRTLLLGGVLPILVFTVVEAKMGTLPALIAGMVWGALETSYEWIRYRKVEAATWIGNGLILVLGTVSLLTSDGIWFKLQPTLIESAIAIVLMGSVAVRKPLLLLMLKAKGMPENLAPEVRPAFEKALTLMTLRVALFFLIHAVLTTYVAFYGSTMAWALLKGVGFTGTFIAYVFIESLILRKKLQKIVS